MITAAMVGLDAQVEQPRIVTTFTTRNPTTMPQLREAQAQIARLVRVELGPVRYCSFLEFTTGKAARSGGRRRPHLHALWKDCDPDSAPLLAGAAASVLERTTGAWRHDAEAIQTPAGATMYVARHHLKESQAPPPEWGRTRRLRPSRGYWSRPAAELRKEAAAVVRDRRLVAKLEASVNGGDVPDEILEAARSQPAAELVHVRELNGRAMEVLGSIERSRDWGRHFDRKTGEVL